MQIESLELFIEVARQGSFAEVARSRDRDASYVSRIISALEKEMGVRLFQRTTRKVALTEPGELFLASVEPLVGALAAAQNEARLISSEPRGHLRLTTSVSFGQQCVVPLLPAFCERFPKISLELIMSDTNLDLVADRVDLAIRLGLRPTGDLISARLMQTRYRVCASPDYLKSSPPLNEPGDLGDHRCLLMPLSGFSSAWRFIEENSTPGQDREYSVDVAGDLFISNALALRDVAVAGLGPALLADWLVRDQLAEKRLVDLFANYRVTPTQFYSGVWLVYPSRSFLAQKVRVAVDFFKEHLGHGQI
ncbi:Transcriptional regulator, LysR family [hydrothermal vent metagenome]|uniref:Transcriptional regulator, LysR family n=1 Tax=hydrothermal vent metagenome TaxID=652676 RepID=A0A3B0UBR8_9ZZZZ